MSSIINVSHGRTADSWGQGQGRVVVSGEEGWTENEDPTGPGTLAHGPLSLQATWPQTSPRPEPGKQLSATTKTAEDDRPRAASAARRGLGHSSSKARCTFTAGHRSGAPGKFWGTSWTLLSPILRFST